MPANSEVDVTLELFPDGGTGWSTATATLAQGDSVLAGGSFDIVSGGVHVSDLEWVSETNG